MTYEEFAKGISEHPKGWRCGFMSGEIYLQASSSTQEEVRVMRDCAYDVRTLQQGCLSSYTYAKQQIRSSYSSSTSMVGTIGEL